MSRAEAKTDHPKILFVRRLLILLLFGFLHYVLLWDGDILHTYAIAGFFLFLFYKRTSYYFNMGYRFIEYFSIHYANGWYYGCIGTKGRARFSLPIMPLEDWLSQIQNRFHAFYADGIGLNLLMLPETVGLFYLVYTPAKGYFPPRERVRSKA